MEAITASNQKLIEDAAELAKLDSEDAKKFAYELLITASEIAAAASKLLMNLQMDISAPLSGDFAD